MSVDVLVSVLYVVILLFASVFAVYVFNTLSLKEKLRLNEEEVKKLEKTMKELHEEINQLKKEIIGLKKELSGEP
ncbi:MAG: hypothetical protein GSR81_00500 [Desulfurococcales archaeon]|nr:hypothetical protein [Desulfurococcales archaeon]